MSSFALPLMQLVVMAMNLVCRSSSSSSAELLLHYPTLFYGDHLPRPYQHHRDDQSQVVALDDCISELSGVQVRNDDRYPTSGDDLKCDREQYTYRWAKGCDYYSTSAPSSAATINGVINNIGYVYNMLTLDLCATTCAVNGLCNYFTYDMDRQLCLLLHHTFDKRNLQVHNHDSFSQQCGYIIA